jgi:branched-chain amino acid transport system substrate-binding protein
MKKSYKNLMLLMIPMLVLSFAGFNVKLTAAPTVNIGILYAKYLVEGGGGFAGHGGQWDGAQMAADEINRAGGINVSGTFEPIVLDFQDEGAYSPTKGTYDTTITTASMQAMLGKDQFIVGGFRTETTQAALATLEAWNTGGNTPVPYFICGSSETTLINGSTPAGKWVFRVTPVNGNFLFGAIAGYMREYLLPKVLAPMYANSTYPADAPGKVRFAVIAEQLTWTAPILGALTAPTLYPSYLGPNATTKGVDGTPYPGYIAVTPGVTYDFASIVSSLKAEGVHLIITVFTLPEVNDLIHAVAAANMPAMIVGIDVPGQHQSHWADLGGSTTVASECNYECFLCWSGTATPTVPGYSDVFWNNFENYTKSIDPTGASWPVYTGAGAYDAVYGIKAAIEKAGTTDPNVLLPVIKATQRMGLTGMFMYAQTANPYEQPNDVLSSETGINWTQGLARSFMVQWVQNTTVPASPYPNVGAQMNVISPTDKVYSRKTQIPPAMYALAAWDIDFNGKVSLSDLVVLANAYGSKFGQGGWNIYADLDNSGTIGLTDLVMLAGHYGLTVPQWPLT